MAQRDRKTYGSLAALVVDGSPSYLSNGFTALNETVYIQRDPKTGIGRAYESGAFLSFRADHSFDPSRAGESSLLPEEGSVDDLAGREQATLDRIVALPRNIAPCIQARSAFLVATGKSVGGYDQFQVIVRKDKAGTLAEELTRGYGTR